ncbi:uncharacterized protein METZ01_LOCUS215972, partial [marine metagenome]
GVEQSQFTEEPGLKCIKAMQTGLILKKLRTTQECIFPFLPTET